MPEPLLPQNILTNHPLPPNHRPKPLPSQHQPPSNNLTPPNKILILITYKEVITNHLRTKPSNRWEKGRVGEVGTELLGVTQGENAGGEGVELDEGTYEDTQA
jgi:hypothetical protein